MVHLRALSQKFRSTAAAVTLLLITAYTVAQDGSFENPFIPPVTQSVTSYGLVELATELTLPVAVIPLDDGSSRLLVTSLEGQVWLLEDGVSLLEPFLSLAGRVTAMAGEQGLFTVALEPEERAVGRGRPRQLVAAYTEFGSDDMVVASYPLAPDLSGADAAQEQVILRFPMPEPFHHGGQVAFGPDGMLYVAVGGGEISNELLHTYPGLPQRLDTPLGKLLRIDLLPADSNELYAVPDDNPFTASSNPAAASAGALPEIWAYGFRNPWKFSFGPDGALYLADVGMDRWEEINLVERGSNYGWPAREGPECLPFPDAPGLVEPDCPELQFAEPLVYYAHLSMDKQGGQAVTGGVIVTDPELPTLLGKYVYGDFVTGRLWAHDPATGDTELLFTTGLAITAIEAGAASQVLLVGIQGVVARLVEER